MLRELRRNPNHAILQDFTFEEMTQIYEMQQDPERYAKMAKSICPRVYGHDEIRKGILLMLFGGVKKTTPEEGMFPPLDTHLNNDGTG